MARRCWPRRWRPRPTRPSSPSRPPRSRPSGTARRRSWRAWPHPTPILSLTPDLRSWRQPPHAMLVSRPLAVPKCDISCLEDKGLHALICVFTDRSHQLRHICSKQGLIDPAGAVMRKARSASRRQRGPPSCQRAEAARGAGARAVRGGRGDAAGGHLHRRDRQHPVGALGGRA